MGAGKRRRTGVDSFLDVAAVEDGNDEDEGELEGEEHFEVSDDDDGVLRAHKCPPKFMQINRLL
ncbi:hypothetical protein PQX77_017873 [Marasmius sp. AFHP31]|nr:hypothetical protein PQX77_017873 [Marasmius sp. AFHP31]